MGPRVHAARIVAGVPDPWERRTARCPWRRVWDAGRGWLASNRYWRGHGRASPRYDNLQYNDSSNSQANRKMKRKYRSSPIGRYDTTKGQPMASTSLQGVVIVADHYREQVRYYRDLLGLDQVADWGDATRLSAANGIDLTIFARSHDARSCDRLVPRRHGLSHLEFGASPAEQKAIEDSLTANGSAAHGQNYLDADGQLLHFVQLGK